MRTIPTLPLLLLAIAAPVAAQQVAPDSAAQLEELVVTADRSPTPTSLLILATDLARDVGLRYVYTGNVIDREHQHTYCPDCKRMIIERNGYELGEYRIVSGSCAYCKTPIAGCFDAEPGHWGSRRMPIRIDGM